MSCITSARPRVLEHHARQSAGTSAAPIYRMVADALRERNISGELIVDVGCGTGGLWPFVQDRFSRYVGVDGMRYAEFSEAIEFRQADLDREPVPMADHSADVVVAVEIIEHLENARAFVRDLVRITKPHGWVLITTPNQRSLLSLATLVLKGRFSAFQDPHYPAHITAMLDVDFLRMAAENGLGSATILHSGHGRIGLTPWHYPRCLTTLLPRALSDNLLLIAEKTGP